MLACVVAVRGIQFQVVENSPTNFVVGSVHNQSLVSSNYRLVLIASINGKKEVINAVLDFIVLSFLLDSQGVCLAALILRSMLSPVS